MSEYENLKALAELVPDCRVANDPDGHYPRFVDEVKRLFRTDDGMALALLSEIERLQTENESLRQSAQPVDSAPFDEDAERLSFIDAFSLGGRIYFDATTRQWLPTRDTIEGFQMAVRVHGLWIGWKFRAQGAIR